MSHDILGLLRTLIREIVVEVLAEERPVAPPSESVGGYEGVPSVARALGVSPQFVTRMCRSGRVAALRAGRSWRVRRADVEAALQVAGGELAAAPPIPHEPSKSEYLTPRDAELCARDRGVRLTHEYIGRLLRAGQIPARRTRSGIWLIEAKDFAAYLESRTSRTANNDTLEQRATKLLEAVRLKRAAKAAKT